ncbi:MAG: hypothetical protein COB15_02260 [Flavobacteriales bacterium]|nr:MAG: hypothetical protein COB15_02260 [Flavobacteriales bacterium]
MLILHRYIKTILLALSILICWVNTFSQTHVYKHYGTEDGLPSSEVYTAFQDSKGYIWFASDAGVSRFNGYEFENFDASDGLTDNTVFLITEDHKGRIWFGTFNCQLSYYFNDSIYHYKHNDKLDTLKNTGTIQSFYIDSADNIYMGFYIKGLFKCDENGDLEQLIKTTNKEIAFSVKLFKIENSLISGIIQNTYNTTSKLIGFDLGLKKQSNPFILKLDKDRGFSCNFNEYKNDVIALIRNTLFIVNKEGGCRKINTPQLFPIEQVIQQVKVYGNYIYVSTGKNGVYKCIIKNNHLVVVDQFLKNTNVSRIFKDKSGGLWFQTLKEGIYFLPTEAITHHSFKNKISAIEIDTSSNDIYLGFENGEVKKSSITHPNQFNQIYALPGKVYDLQFNYGNSSLLIGGSNQFVKYNKNNTPYTSNLLGGKSYLIEDSVIYVAHTFGLQVLKTGGKPYYTHEKDNSTAWCSSVLRYQNKIWVGSKNGVKIYLKGKLNNLYPTNKYLTSQITSLAKLNKETLLIGTKPYGLIIFKDNKIIDIIDKEDGLTSNLIKSIHVDNEKTIWVGTNKGLNRINYKGTGGGNIYQITKKHGLVSTEILKIHSLKNIIYATTPSGLIQIDRAKLDVNKTPPPIYIIEFKANSSIKNTQNEINLSYKENFITIKYEGLNYKSLGEVKYKYRLVGADTNWTTTTSRMVQYPSLQLNNYTFEIKAKNEDGYWSRPTSIAFTIKPPYWKTWWFIILEILIGILIVFMLFRYREKQNNKRIENEKKVIELELKSLRSQMNPHFIFNTLNAIQNAVNTLDRKIASNYVADFGRLIRIVLESSKNTMITIDTEIEMLTLYINLEAIRFPNKFTYNLIIDPELQNDIYKIPTMVLQPFIENAIIHGLAPKKEEGLMLSIEFKLTDEETLLCIIEDNGIGRKTARKINELNNLNKTSMGMDITKERLNLYDREIDKQFDFKIIDLTNKNKPSGTRVEVIFTV